MEKLQGYEKAEVIKGSSQLPLGGYVCKILECEEISGTSRNGTKYSYLKFSFDVCEGEHKEHYKNVWNEEKTKPNRKWKGYINYFTPNGDNYDEQMNSFKTMMTNIEEENRGFKWDWDVKKLKDKKIGVVYGEKDILTERGELITIIEPRYITTIKKIKDGNFKIPKHKTLGNDVIPVSTPSRTKPEAVDLDAIEEENEDELPF